MSETERAIEEAARQIVEYSQGIFVANEIHDLKPIIRDTVDKACEPLTELLHRWADLHFQIVDAEISHSHSELRRETLAALNPKEPPCQK